MEPSVLIDTRTEIQQCPERKECYLKNGEKCMFISKYRKQYRITK